MAQYQRPPGEDNDDEQGEVNSNNNEHYSRTLSPQPQRNQSTTDSTGRNGLEPNDSSLQTKHGTGAEQQDQWTDPNNEREEDDDWFNNDDDHGGNQQYHPHHFQRQQQPPHFMQEGVNDTDDQPCDDDHYDDENQYQQQRQPYEFYDNQDQPNYQNQQENRRGYEDNEDNRYDDEYDDEYGDYENNHVHDQYEKDDNRYYQYPDDQEQEHHMSDHRYHQQQYDDQSPHDYYDDGHHDQHHQPPLEMAPDYDVMRELTTKNNEERLLKEKQEEDEKSKRQARRLWVAILLCLVGIVILILGIYLLKRGGSDDASSSMVNVTLAPAPTAVMDNEPSLSTMNSSSARIPTAAPTREDLTAPTPSPVATVPQVADVRVDLIGGTDLLNDMSNTTLTDSCNMFLLDYLTDPAVQDVECFLVAQELVERTMPQRTRRRLSRSTATASSPLTTSATWWQWTPRRHLQSSTTVPALRVNIQATAHVNAAVGATILDRPTMMRLIENKLAMDDFVTILLNSRDGAFTSVSDIVLSDDELASGSGGTPGPTPLLGLEPMPVPSASVPPDATVNEENGPESDASTVAPTAGASGGGVNIPLEETPAPAPLVTLAPITAFPTVSPTLPMDIQTKLEQIIGTDKFDTLLSNPYNKALAWIEQSDPMQMTALTPNLVQRFIAVYVYYATSTLRDWLSCGPVDTSGAGDACIYKKVTDMNPIVTEDIPATKWLSSVGECTWVGIECDETAQIKIIELSGMNMTGSFPAGLEFLPSLKHVMMTSGELRGTIPTDVVSRMTSLVNLDLQYNLLSGPFPMAGFGVAIENIFLSNNLLVGSLSETDVARLTNLQGLLVAKNALSGSIPNAIGLLTNLQYLRLNNNALMGQIPTTLANLVLLSEVALQENQLSGNIPSTLATMTALTDIRLGSNRLTGSIPDSLYDLVRVTRLELFSNALTGTVSPRVGQMTALETLKLYNNTLVGSLAVELNQLAATLKSAWFFANALTGTVPLCAVAMAADIVADCLLDVTTNLPEIACPCCSQCCDAAGQACYPNAV